VVYCVFVVYPYNFKPVCVLYFQHATLNELVFQDTVSRHECGFPAPTYDNLSGLNDVTIYTDNEQEKIWDRLLPNTNVQSTDSSVRISLCSDNPKKSDGTAAAGCKLPKGKCVEHINLALPSNSNKKEIMTAVSSGNRLNNSSRTTCNELLTADNIRSKYVSNCLFQLVKSN